MWFKGFFRLMDDRIKLVHRPKDADIVKAAAQQAVNRYKARFPANEISLAFDDRMYQENIRYTWFNDSILSFCSAMEASFCVL